VADGPKQNKALQFGTKPEGMRIPTSSDGAALAEFIRQVDFAA